MYDWRVKDMPEAFSRKTLLDLAAAFFLLGSILVLVISILSVPIETVYPTFKLRIPLTYSYLVAVIIGIVGAILGLDCFSMTTKRNLSNAGVRGIVIGAVLLSISWAAGLSFQIVGAGAVLILIAGIICYIYREE